MVFLTLVGALTGTCALLLALAPAPLAPGAARSLFAIESSQSIDDVFDTTAPLRGGHWKYIYIHQSGLPSGDAQSLANAEQGLPDHFVIGNGNGCVDGELQAGSRWTEQQSPGLPRGLDRIDPNCISVCLIGDLNQSAPTPTQQARLIQLVNALQRRLNIPARAVVTPQTSQGVAGVGTLFPVSSLRAQLLP